MKIHMYTFQVNQLFVDVKLFISCLFISTHHIISLFLPCPFTLSLSQYIIQIIENQIVEVKNASGKK